MVMKKLLLLLLLSVFIAMLFASAVFIVDVFRATDTANEIRSAPSSATWTATEVVTLPQKNHCLIIELPWMSSSGDLFAVWNDAGNTNVVFIPITLPSVYEIDGYANVYGIDGTPNIQICRGLHPKVPSL